AMHAGLELQPREDATPRHRGDDLLVAAGFAFARRYDLDAPALLGRIALIHAEKIACEKRRLVAAGPGADFENRVLLVSLVLRQEQELKLLAKLFHPAGHLLA